MLLGFKKQFATFVEKGSKRQTVRAIRRRAFRVGDRLDMYTDVRTKKMRLLRRAICSGVQQIRFFLRATDSWQGMLEFCIEIDGIELSIDEKNAFARADGFRPKRGTPIGEMAIFWNVEYGGFFKGWEWTGQVIHWNP